MKILHVITSLETGGAEHLMVDLLPKLVAHGHEVELAIFNGHRTPFYEQIEAAGITIRRFSESGSVYNPKHILKLIKLMRGFDIVHSHNTSPQYYVAVASIFSPSSLVTTEHNTYNRRRGKWIFAIADRWMYRRYEEIICISEKARVNLLAHLCEKMPNVCVIPNGVDVKLFSEASPSADIEEKYRGLKTAIMVAGFRPQKDQMTLIRAYKYLPEDFHLLLVGDGELKNECEMEVRHCHLEGRVHLLGMRTDVPNLLKSADVVVMSTHYEGLSLSNLEGMSSGKPFIASEVDGITEVTQGYGVMFPEGDEKALAREILRLSEDKEYYQTTAQRCSMRAIQYDIQKMVDGYEGVYRKLLNN